MDSDAAALALEDLAIGQRYEFETAVADRDIDRFAALSGDVSPLHIDADFARRRGFDDRLVHGAHLVALASRLVGMSLPGRNALLLKLEMSFAAPVAPGTRVRVTGTVEQLSEAVRSAVVGIRITDAGTLAPLARGKATVGFTEERRDA
ncbi:MAG TPA: MaoC/PaaZ C-terminal domain-containing protein [Stellaceae bacterium]